MIKQNCKETQSAGEKLGCTNIKQYSQCCDSEVRIVGKDYEFQLKMNSAYVMKEEFATDGVVFAYPRLLNLQNGELGFSVMDNLLDTPDLSQCGVFWIHPMHFEILFKLVER